VDELAWLGVLRHGQSIGNVAADRAEALGGELVDIDVPDPDVPLSELGVDQATAVGRWLAELPADRRPTLVISSTYRRAAQTAEFAVAQFTPPVPIHLDERIRDRELGILDRLTAAGVTARWPQEQQRRQFLGNFYYRPPGGESWADVALRLRAALTDLRREHAGQRVLLVAHEAVILLLRYIIEELPVQHLLEIARRPLSNTGLTSWQPVDGRLRLAGFDDDSAARELAEPTRQSHV